MRPSARGRILLLAAGESIHPLIIRQHVGNAVKSGALRAEVYTKPEKEHGLRIQTSEVLIGPPGCGKGLGHEWFTQLIDPTEQMLCDYALTEYNAKVIGRIKNNKKRKLDSDINSTQNAAGISKAFHSVLFKDVDGIEKIGNLPLPLKVKLPLGSNEAVLLASSRNSGAGLICIEEYIRSKHR